MMQGVCYRRMLGGAIVAMTDTRAPASPEDLLQIALLCCAHNTFQLHQSPGAFGITAAAVYYK